MYLKECHVNNMISHPIYFLKFMHSTIYFVSLTFSPKPSQSFKPTSTKSTTLMKTIFFTTQRITFAFRTYTVCKSKKLYSSNKIQRTNKLGVENLHNFQEFPFFFSLYSFPSLVKCSVNLRISEFYHEETSFSLPKIYSSSFERSTM